MKWDEFFRDLEGQFGDARDAERAALAEETERLRIASLDLASRFRALSVDAATVQIGLQDQRVVVGTVSAAGADWFGVLREQGGMELVRYDAVQEVRLPSAAVVRSTMPVPAHALAARVTWGFVLRDLARRRSYSTVHALDGRSYSGTIDRAGADHCDIAVHDPETQRRKTDVRTVTIVGFSSMSSVTIQTPISPAFV